MRPRRKPNPSNRSINRLRRRLAAPLTPDLVRRPGSQYGGAGLRGDRTLNLRSPAFYISWSIIVGNSFYFGGHIIWWIAQ